MIDIEKFKQDKEIIEWVMSKSHLDFFYTIILLAYMEEGFSLSTAYMRVQEQMLEISEENKCLQTIRRNPNGTYPHLDVCKVKI